MAQPTSTVSRRSVSTGTLSTWCGFWFSPLSISCRSGEGRIRYGDDDARTPQLHGHLLVAAGPHYSRAHCRFDTAFRCLSAGREDLHLGRAGTREGGSGGDVLHALEV